MAKAVDLRTRVVILGSGALASMVARHLEHFEPTRVTVVGMVDDQPPPDDWPWLGPLDQLRDIVETLQPDRLVLALQDRRKHLPLTDLLASRVRGLVVEDALEVDERVTGKIAIESLRPGTLILSKGFRNHGAPKTIAHIISVVAATIGLILLAPLLALVALAIKLDSRGPVLFIQDRAGMDGTPFRLLKFRTMACCDAPTSEWVKDNSERITRVGRLLRRTHVDELPQLVNILRGEMNLVGPRPHPMTNQRVFLERIAYYSVRSTVRPGVTGWAQIRYGYANSIEEETEKMRYDLYYIKNRSMVLDLRIVLETIGVILLGRGSSNVLASEPAATVPDTRHVRLASPAANALTRSL